MLGSVIMRKKRTAVCSRFQSQFRPLTSEIGKAEQCPAMRKDHPVSDFKKKVRKAHVAYSGPYPWSG